MDTSSFLPQTLYSNRCGINEAMTQKIQEYFSQLGLATDEANNLHKKSFDGYIYIKEYGLAIRGLIRHHKIDPIDYDQRCDSALPLEDLLEPNPTLRRLLLDIDRSKARVWCITNAFKLHALRVLRILGVSDLIEGVVSCDYTSPNFHCKPEQGSIPIKSINKSKHVFVDDSLINIIGAVQFGFGSTVLFDEDGLRKPKEDQGFERIESLEELRNLKHWKTCFKTFDKELQEC
ncbi:uncharacterized protein MELLADRAFT_34578 [Melampsora larici-populina 98AG31]|uniref:Pyrimidine 5-nucleotidase n=1 Tax=Melampsora larici-populina (strain 98AG31 / pathotype 3-4-7) TaxID=747676 RepID=F4REZ2_MELLP|nr:uncharacterized protein MELLADRAFT_34578 [Melampsora larici-populina 98AG31]EGG09193.1 hypothetical protein MELLADRAFT_34578 [Melampsora larici-populina 98AG31]